MDLPDEWTAGTVSANGIDIRYYRAGSGDPVVLAHGMYADGRCWARLGSDLADEYEVVAYDARGHGRSDAPETGYDIDTRVADLVGLVAELGLDDPVLGGHSMGAATVAWAAAEHPSLPRGVFLEDPSRFRGTPETSVEAAREAGRERLRESKSRSVEERVERHYEEAGRDDHDEAQVRRLAVATDDCSPHVVKIAQEHPPVERAFDDVACRTLVLRRDVGVDDRVEDLRAAERLADGRLVHVPDAGHHVFLDEYDAAAAELRTFLRRL
ncbi:alpha/beta fold hydrolase [Halostella litorea]|uniref:alpha/beta fold hydrolase n=1 Tax=Halostella litorea TaxID=2528831 RepID=UPI001091A637|nr:alpha/beta hydrolase [Halostella litorea]